MLRTWCWAGARADDGLMVVLLQVCVQSSCVVLLQSCFTFCQECQKHILRLATDKCIVACRHLWHMTCVLAHGPLGPPESCLGHSTAAFQFVCVNLALFTSSRPTALTNTRSNCTQTRKMITDLFVVRSLCSRRSRHTNIGNPHSVSLLKGAPRDNLFCSALKIALPSLRSNTFCNAS